MRVLSFFAHGEYFAVDVSLVRQVARNMTFSPVPAAPEEVVGITNIKGRVVTVLSLASLLGRGALTAAELSGTVCAIILKPVSGGDIMGIYIDKPGEIIDINDDAILPSTLTIGEEEKRCISGMAEVEGRLYRILNIEAITNMFINDAVNTGGP